MDDKDCRVAGGVDPKADAQDGRPNLTNLTNLTKSDGDREVEMGDETRILLRNKYRGHEG